MVPGGGKAFALGPSFRALRSPQQVQRDPTQAAEVLRAVALALAGLVPPRSSRPAPSAAGSPPPGGAADRLGHSGGVGAAQARDEVTPLDARPLRGYLARRPPPRPTAIPASVSAAIRSANRRADRSSTPAASRPGPWSPSTRSARTRAARRRTPSGSCHPGSARASRAMPADSLWPPARNRRRFPTILPAISV